MKIGIIADDLTGANDTGVKLAQKGIKTSVILRLNQTGIDDQECIVYDTDSRYLEPENAYDRVKSAGFFLKENGYNLIYKKMDSTLRGNIGIELDALYDVFHPDYVVIAPAFPKGGRVLKEGHLFLNGKRLDQSEYAGSPTDSDLEYDIMKKISRQSKYKARLIRKQELNRQPLNHILINEAKENTPYLIFDSIEENDLKMIVHYLCQSNHKLLWAGSAGLINYLPEAYGIANNNDKPNLTVTNYEDPALIVVGSFNDITLKQMNRLCKSHNTNSIKVNIQRILLSEVEKSNEINRTITESINVLKQGNNLVLYASKDKQEVYQTIEFGKSHGRNFLNIGKEISKILGLITKGILKNINVSGLILTGGDTAKEVCKQIGVETIELFDELSPAIPIGKTDGKINILTITKGGSIGDENALVLAVNFLRNN